jgi:phosphoribosylformimino-5-aminoimidazole carboxamide ribotide isomerase
MEIIPAVDIRGGKCVRLYQGKYDQETVFHDDPVAVALKWRAQGARWLHVVDLDGARTGEPKNLEIVKEIMKRSALLVEFGGGVREERIAEQLVLEGVTRVILGTAAIENRELIRRLCRRFGEAIAVSLDAQDGRVAIRGWRKETAVDVSSLSEDMISIGVRRLIYTDIKRDGTLTEPNFDIIRKLVARVSVPIIVAGGVSRLEHLQRLRDLGVDGVIIGKALYTGDIDLEEAINSLGT